jgi:shikimate O-hydroxycinnamoyltransferase
VAAALAPLDVGTGSEAARFTLVQGTAGCRLAASMSHAVVDGFSFVSFLCSWARLARGLPGLPVSRQRIVPVPCAEPVTPERVLADCGAFWRPGHKRSMASGLELHTRRFSFEQLAGERARVREARGVSVSDNDLIAAQLWREFGAAAAGADGDSNLTCPVDARPLCRQLGRAHLGCAITFATAALPVARVRDASLAELALGIRKAVSAVDEARVNASMSTFAGLCAQRGPGALDEVHLTHPERGLLVTNLSRLPLQELDFGAGPPRTFDAGVQLPRCAVLCACPGGVEARVYLPARAGAARQPLSAGVTT